MKINRISQYIHKFRIIYRKDFFTNTVGNDKTKRIKAKGMKFMYNKNRCEKIKTVSIFALIFLAIALIIVVVIINNNNPMQQPNILVATAVSRR